MGNSPHFQFDENESPSNVIASFNAVKSSANKFPDNSTRRDYGARIMAPSYAATNNLTAKT